MARRHRGTDRNPEIDVTEKEPTLAELFTRLSAQVSTLMRDEVALAKTELKTEVRKAGKAGGMLGSAAFTGYMTLVMLSFAAAWGLAAIIPTGWAFLVVAAFYGLVTAVLGLTGRKKAQQVDPVPRATIETLQEDAQWAKDHKP